MKPKNDFRRAAGNDSAFLTPPAELDSSDPWDAAVIAEADYLRKWTGIDARLVHVTDGTAAYSDNTICIDKAQLNGFFGKFTGDKYQTAIFFALAHEFGHLCQLQYWGVDEALNMPSIEAEAHADYLAGIWLGLRLTQGQQRLSEDVFEAGIQLKSDTSDYPTAYQRGRLLQDAMGQAVLLVHVIEPQIPGSDDYTKFDVCLNEQDVRDLFETASSRLAELPADGSWEKLIVRSVFRGPFRRA